MYIRINETGNIQELNIIDMKSGCNWIGDLLGNYGVWDQTGNGYDEEKDIHHMTTECFEWWENFINHQTKADKMLAEVSGMVDCEQYELLNDEINDICTCDLEDQPGYIIDICERWLKKLGC